MKTHLLWVSLLSTLFESSYQVSPLRSRSYIGAVVEYHPVTNADDAGSVAEKNANYYKSSFVRTASQYDVDIIVFPEFGLTSLPKDGSREKRFNATEYRAFYRDVASYVPSPEEAVAPCDVDGKYKESLRIVSCAARQFKMYVVVNHHERADCPKPNCAPDNFLLYNTNVVFDRSGKVIARYRKYNLFNEAGTNVTAQPEHSTFVTDFGVTFGQFVCFDILQEKPTSYLVRNPNVTDIVYSTHWFDELPFNDAVQQQAAWAYGADVNLLASAYSDAQTASGGSGIYNGKHGPIKVYQPRKTSDALIVAEIPKYKEGKRVVHTKAIKPIVVQFVEDRLPTMPKRSDANFDKYYSANFRDDLRPYTTELLDPWKSYSTTLCDRGLCCDFEVKTHYDKELVAGKPAAKQYSYRFVVFNGVRNLANVTTAGIQVCALVACAGDRIEDCGAVYPSNINVVHPTDILSLLITRRANPRERVFYEPSTLTLKRRLPLEDDDFSYIVSGHDASSLLLMYLVKPQKDLMTFGIYGRTFDRDGEKPTELILPNKSKADDCNADKKNCAHSEL